MEVYFAICVFLLILAVISNRLSLGAQKILYVFLSICLILFAGLRSRGVDFDNNSYLFFYKLVPTMDKFSITDGKFFNSLHIEPSLIIIFSFVKTYLGDFQFCLIIYSIISVTTKSVAVYKMSNNIFYSILILFSSIFLLQDMTQIRESVAVGFILLAIFEINNKGIVRYYVFISLAIFFHYSSILFIPLYFINIRSIDPLKYLLIILIPLLVSLVGIEFSAAFKYLDLGIITEKINMYTLYNKHMNLTINKFNFNILIQLLVSLLFLYLSIGSELDSLSILLIKLSCIGVAFFYFFYNIPAIALRSNELISVVQIILLPRLLKRIKPQYAGEIIVCMIALLHLVNQLIMNPIINSYELVKW